MGGGYWKALRYGERQTEVDVQVRWCEPASLVLGGSVHLGFRSSEWSVGAARGGFRSSVAVLGEESRPYRDEGEAVDVCPGISVQLDGGLDLDIDLLSRTSSHPAGTWTMLGKSLMGRNLAARRARDGMTRIVHRSMRHGSLFILLNITPCGLARAPSIPLNRCNLLQS